MRRLQEVHSFGTLWVTVGTLAFTPVETRKPLKHFEHKRHGWAAGLRRDYEEQGGQGRQAHGRGSCKLQARDGSSSGQGGAVELGMCGDVSLGLFWG